MGKYAGTVSKTGRRDWGTKKIYSWQVEDSNTWFRSEEGDPDIQIGDSIVFEGDTPNKIISVQKVAPEVVEKGKAAAKSQDVPPTNSPDYWRWKQMEDIKNKESFLWRDARTDAARLVTCALDNECLDMPKNLTKGKKYELFMAYFHEITEELFNEAKEKLDGSG